MSKMDALRAMREARYAAAQKGTSTSAPKPATPKVRPKAATDVGTPAADSGGDLCGHRAISGRTCTREKGHAAKSHRYS